MRSFKDTGIAFKKKELNEADVIFSILTKYHGRVDAIAKGIRKPTSRKSGNIDLMTFSKFHFAKGQNLDVITEAELVNDFGVLKKKLKSTFDLFYICELLENFLQVGEKQDETFRITYELLLTLQHSENTMPIRAFEIKLASLHGFEPHFDYCLGCGSKLKENETKYISFESLGIVCSCKKSKGNIKVSDKMLKILKFLKNENILNSSRIDVDKKVEKEIQKITKSWLENILEKEMRSKKCTEPIFFD
jgi:DNA repair protein RecO (recombination protein O)